MTCYMYVQVQTMNSQSSPGVILPGENPILISKHVHVSLSQSSELPLPIPWNQTSDVHRGSSLIM